MSLVKHTGQGHRHTAVQGRTGHGPERGHGKAEGTLEGPVHDWFDPWIDHRFYFVS